MSKTEKELAFLHGLALEPEWTQKFTDILDETVEIKDIETLTYINAGAGNHTIELQERLGDKTEVFPVCQTEELQKIARIKAEATKSKLDFSTSFPMAEADLVIADASFVRPSELNDFLARAVGASNDSVVFFLPTSGSFGEVFSYLWEVLLDLELLGDTAEVEHLITDLPTVSHVEEMFRNLGMKNIETTTKNEFFEYDTGEGFTKAPLVESFLLPVWLGFLSQMQKKQVTTRLAQKIDEDCQGMSFRFTVKATVIGGGKSDK